MSKAAGYSKKPRASVVRAVAGVSFGAQKKEAPGILSKSRTTVAGPTRAKPSLLRIEIERGEDGRFIADIPGLPGVMVYGSSRDEAIVKAKALALRVLADRIDQKKMDRRVEALFSVA